MNDARATTAPDPGLAALMHWMQAVVVHPGGVRAGEEEARAALDASIEDVVLATGELDAQGHVEVYAKAYFLRLVEILEGDFPGLRAALGAEAFRELGRGYVTRYPSRHFSLNGLGRDVPAFVRETTQELEGRAFLAELAQLECVLEDVFDRAEHPALDTDALLAVPNEAWPGACLVPRPTLVLCAFDYPVDDWFTAFRADDVRPLPDPQASWLAVNRRDFSLWRYPLSREQHALLEALGAGHPLGAALEQCATLPDVDVAALGASVGEWFQEWTGAGFFERVEL